MFRVPTSADVDTIVFFSAKGFLFAFWNWKSQATDYFNESWYSKAVGKEMLMEKKKKYG